MADTEREHVVSVPQASDRAGGTGLDRYFGISDRGSTVRTEVVGGLTTWLTMAYILFLNPAILGTVTDRAGVTLPFDQLLTVTALVAGVATLAMGLYARYPFAIASGLGLNGFVAFTLVAGSGLTWPEAMGVILVEGAIITVLVLTGFREAVLNAIPKSLKLAIGIGIGLFLMIIGLENAGVVVNNDVTLVGLTTDFTNLRMIVFALGLGLSAVLVARKVRGGLLLSILLSTLAAILINEIWGDGTLWESVGPGVAQVPSDVVSAPDFGLVGNVSLGFFGTLGFLTALVPIFAVMLSDFFDTMGTAVALGEEGRLLDDRGRLPGMNRVLLVDSLAAAAGGLASSS
jgi:adenine/guanine/hypoxanthine permease